MLQRSKPTLVLASASASRRALLAAAGLDFAIWPADIDEASVRLEARAQGATAEQTARRLADLKAASAARRVPEALVIGADQILVCDGVWFDKPANPAAALAQLRALRGRDHILATAVVCHRNDGPRWGAVVSPRLTMRDFSDDFLDDYIALEGDAVTTTVGAYRLEGHGVHLFSEVEGDHSAVVGLPLLPLLSFLREEGVLAQ
jgi:septum formation protein